MSLIGQTIHGNILIESIIGEGAMGAVYLARNVELSDRTYAVKVLLNAITDSPKFQDRFDEEARHQASLDHPNIVRVQDYFRENGRYFLVMDYIDGQPLSTIICNSGKLDEKRALAIMDDVLRALDCANAQGIIHRDVKPSNILIDKSGRARLTDFGIAIRAGELRLTSTGGATVGTAAYMSPEQVRAPGDINHLTDVYSAGIVLFEMLTGDVPFHGETDFLVQQQQVKARPPNVRVLNGAISARVTRIISMALEKDPRKRIQGCEQFRRLLSGELDPPFPWMHVAMGGAALLLCAALMASAPRWRLWLVRALGSPPARIDPARIHDSATAALQSLELFCREAGIESSKLEGKRLAENLPDSASAAAFEQQAREAQSNMREFAGQYDQGIAKLAGYAPAAVAAAFGSTDSAHATFINLVEDDVRRIRASHASVDSAKLSVRCRKSATGSP